MVAGQDVTGDALKVRSFDAGGSAGEVFIHHLLGQADAFENLRPKVTLNRGDPDLGGHLDNPLGRRLHEVFAGGVVIDPHEQTLADHVVEGFESQIRIDRGTAITNQGAEVMDFPGFAGFQHEADAGALANPDQVVVQASHRHERRDHGIVFVDPAVTQDDDIDPGINLQAGLIADFFQRGLQALGSEFRVEEGRDGDGAELTLGDFLELGQFLIGEDRRLQFDQVAAGRDGLEQVALRPDGGDGGGHDFLSDTVNRRIGDLGEELFEVVVEQLGFIRKHRQRDIRPH